MKSGCILKTILSVIFIIGVGSYIFKTYGPDFKASVEEKAKKVIQEKIESELTSVKDDILRTELDNLINNYFDAVKDSAYSIVKESGDSLSNYLATALKDSILDNNEIHFIRKMIKNE